MLRFVELLGREPDFPKARVAFMVAVSGLAGGSLLVAVTVAAQGIARHRPPDPRLFFVTLILLALTIHAQHDFLVRMALAVEEVLLRLRLRIGNLLRHADLRWVEDAGTAALQAPLAQDTQPISQSALSLALLARSALAVLVCLVYLGWISPPALLAALTFAAVYAFIQTRFLYPGLARKLADNRALEGVFRRRWEALFGGFKELKLDRRASDGWFERYAWAAGDSSAGKRDINLKIARGFSFGYSVFYLLLLVLALAIPGLDGALGGRGFTIAAAALFLLSELGPWLTWIPEIVRADAALETLCRLEQTLLEAPHADPAARPPEPPFPFGRLRLEAVCFQYGDAGGPPAVGPLDLELNRGELLFIAGGTGSGKTTLLKLLAGLYRPRSGILRVDGHPIDASGIAGYRELFAAVFPDFHLSERRYGLPAADPARVRQWLKTLGLAGKTGFAEGGFSWRDLSSGERQRLAFTAAVLKEKPVLLLDGFGGDQDPEFRDRFYREILRDLKQQGTTVVVATQDERYFGLADRVVTMADGKLR